MKKLFVYVSVVGLAAGVAYWLYKKERTNNTASKLVDKKVDFESRPQKDEISRNSNVVKEMYQAKSESAKEIYDRHSRASEIMKDAYSNIMQDFVEDYSDEKSTNEKEKNESAIIDGESASVMKEIDLISDELDDLLK